jgi:hypothetical protein
MSLQTKTYYSRQLGDIVNYTVIPMDKLDLARAELHKSLSNTNIPYKLRTFYIGPRRSDNATTNKSDALYAKIAIYKLMNKCRWPVLHSYL